MEDSEASGRSNTWPMNRWLTLVCLEAKGVMRVLLRFRRGGVVAAGRGGEGDDATDVISMSRPTGPGVLPGTVEDPRGGVKRSSHVESSKSGMGLFSEKIFSLFWI